MKKTGIYFKIFIFIGLIIGLQIGHTMVDFHTHIASKKMKDSFPFFPDHYVIDANNLIAELDKNNINSAVILGSGYLYALYNKKDRKQRVEFENNFIAHEAAKYPNRLVAFCSVPFLDKWIFEEIARCGDVLKLKGLKIHLENNEIDLAIPQHSKRFLDILQKADKYKMIVTVHCKINHKASFIELFKLVLGRPTKIVIAHGLSDDYKNLIQFQQVDGPPGFLNNIFIDLSIILKLYSNAPKSVRQDVIWHIRSIQIDNILFGSDFPVASMTQALEVLKNYTKTELGSVGFDQEELNKILNDNGKKLLFSTS